MRAFGPPPSLEEIEALGRRALASLPEPFAGHVVGLLFQVEDFADEQTLASMGIEDGFSLTGLYEGTPLSERSSDGPPAFPDRIRLFRRPLLDEWAEGQDTLEALVTHVVIHEVGHHFGLSDGEMHALEEGS